MSTFEEMQRGLAPRREQRPQERRPLRVINPYVTAAVLAAVVDARGEGWSADEIARHLHKGSPRDGNAALTIAGVLHAWAYLLEADAGV